MSFFPIPSSFVSREGFDPRNLSKPRMQGVQTVIVSSEKKPSLQFHFFVGLIDDGSFSNVLFGHNP